MFIAHSAFGGFVLVFVHIICCVVFVFIISCVVFVHIVCLCSIRVYDMLCSVCVYRIILQIEGGGRERESQKFVALLSKQDSCTLLHYMCK